MGAGISSRLPKNFPPLCHCTIVLAIIIRLIQLVKRGRKIFSKAGPGVLLVSIHHLLVKEVTKGVQFCNLSSFLPLSGEKKNRSVPIDKAAGLGIMNIEGCCRMAVSPMQSTHEVDRSGCGRTVNTLLWLVCRPKRPDTPETGVPSTTVFSTSASPPFDAISGK